MLKQKRKDFKIKTFKRMRLSYVQIGYIINQVNRKLSPVPAFDFPPQNIPTKQSEEIQVGALRKFLTSLSRFIEICLIKARRIFR